ncbi:MAG: PEP-CTERM sorting domain-containing protein [Gammaproteobacteria bacterium]|nr:PEP-CTERM sorting domain-containing protein [Gammaproteobacteria bacterium]
MTKISKLIMLASMAIIIQISPAQALMMDGEISISGGFVPADGTNLQDATAVDFLEWTGSAYVSGTTGGSFTVTSASGDFANYVTPSPFILGTINDFSLSSPFTPVTPLWQIGGFSFDLLNISILEQTANVLTLSGTGQIYGNQFERTDGQWIMTANGGESTFSWSSTTASVPEPATMWLMSMGMMGLIGFRRKNA